MKIFVNAWVRWRCKIRTASVFTFDFILICSSLFLSCTDHLSWTANQSGHFHRLADSDLAELYVHRLGVSGPIGYKATINYTAHFIAPSTLINRLLALSATLVTWKLKQTMCRTLKPWHKSQAPGVHPLAWCVWVFRVQSNKKITSHCLAPSDLVNCPFFITTCNVIHMEVKAAHALIVEALVWVMWNSLCWINVINK